MRVFLIHGMGRTPVSMWILAQRLARAGHETTLFGYAVTVESLPAIAQRFVARVDETLSGAGDAVRDADAGGAAPEPYAVVGHSLGNIITRFASADLPPGLCRFAMIAPPNQPPAMARTLRDNHLFKWLARDAGQRLTDPDFYADLSTPEVPSLIIAGTRGPRWRRLPFDGRPNDSVVSVDETRLGNIRLVEVHGAHTFLMNRRDVFDLIQAFLAAPPPERDSATIHD